MKRARRRPRRVGGVPLVAGGAALAALALWIEAPRVCGLLPTLRVREVAFAGMRYLTADAVLGAMALPERANICMATAPLEIRLRRLGGVADASVERRLPGTLEVRITEIEPAALAPGEDGPLVAVDARGHALPYDPSRRGLDLPVVAAADSSVVGVVALVQAVNPTLFAGIESAAALPSGDVALALGPVRVLLRRDATAADVEAVALVSEDLAAKGRAYTELDARFAGQVVVRGHAAPRRPPARGGRSV